MKGNDLTTIFYFHLHNLKKSSRHCLTIAGYAFLAGLPSRCNPLIVVLFRVLFVLVSFVRSSSSSNQIITIIIFSTMTWQQLCTTRFQVSTIPSELMKIIIIIRKITSIQQLTVLRALLASCCYNSVVLYLFLRIVNVCVCLFLLQRNIRNDTI